MTMTAVRIACVAYDAACRHFEAAVEFFSPGVPVPLRVAVVLPARQDLSHPVLVRGLVGAAQRKILR